MTRRIDESNPVVVGQFHVERADALRDAARFLRRHTRLPQVVQQRRLSVVHVTHHRDHRRTRGQVVWTRLHVRRLEVELVLHAHRDVQIHRQQLHGVTTHEIVFR